MNELQRLIYNRGMTLGTVCERAGICRKTLWTVMNRPKEFAHYTDTFNRIGDVLGMKGEEIRELSGNSLAGHDHPICREMMEQNITTAQFCREHGIPYATVQHIVKHRYEKLQRFTEEWIAKELGVPVERII